MRGGSVHDVGSRSGDRDVAQDTAVRNTSSQPLRSLIARVQTRQSRCASGRSDSPLIRGSTITKRMSRPLGRGAEPTSSMLFLPPMPARRLRCAAAACAPNSIHSPTCQTRVIWRKLDCLKPNLQKMEFRIRRKDVCNRRRPCFAHGKSARQPSGPGAMPSEGI